MAQNQAADSKNQPPLLKEDGTLQYPTQDDTSEEVSMSEAKRKYRQSLLGQFDFREKCSDQINYIRKVLAIVTAEFLLTGLLTWLCSWSSIFAGLLANKLIGWVAFFALIPLVVIIFIKDDLRKEVPLNYLSLLGVAGCEAISVASLTRDMEASTVFMIIGILFVTVFTLFMVALKTENRQNLSENFFYGVLVSTAIQAIFFPLALVNLYG